VVVAQKQRVVALQNVHLYVIGQIAASHAGTYNGRIVWKSYLLASP
jgi:hypothetical protein